jgi:glycosyltransferase involved in cell wall biosynthesis
VQGDLTVSAANDEILVALLTGGADEPYAYGLATALMSNGIALDLIANDELNLPEFHGDRRVNFLNLRGDQRPDASFVRKIIRVSMYYAKLIRYAATARPRIFHVLWNNKFESFDRTMLMAYYRALGKKIVLTAHNVNAAKRDSKDSYLNRLTLRIQYQLSDYVFVHTEKMKRELVDGFHVPETRVIVIPFGINNAVPSTQLTPGEAKRRLGIMDGERTILFFGNIAPYKGLEDLIAAFKHLRALRNDYRLLIAGQPKASEQYWTAIQKAIHEDVVRGRALLRGEHVPDAETEVYFKAADVLVLPYRYIYQSGVLFLGQSFGLPVLVADVGSLKDEIVEGQTGFVFRPEDPIDLARTIEKYFDSDLYLNLKRRRQEIREHAIRRHSWDVVSHITTGIYAGLLEMSLSDCSSPLETAAKEMREIR